MKREFITFRKQSDSATTNDTSTTTGVELEAKAMTARKSGTIRVNALNSILSLMLVQTLMLTMSCDPPDEKSQASSATGTGTTATGTNSQQITSTQQDRVAIDNEFVGVWENEGNYLEIKTDNRFSFFECATNKTYKETNVGTLSNGTLTVDSVKVSLSVANDLLTLTFSSPDFMALEYKKVSSVPESCESDAIEITSVSPSDAIQGVSTEFTVTFDYTLSSADLGVIKLGFNLDGEYVFTMTDSLLEVTKGSGSGSLKAKVAPKFYDSVDFLAYVNIFKQDHDGGAYSPYASAEHKIEVRPSNSLNGYDSKENNFFSSLGKCLPFKNCKSH